VDQENESKFLGLHKNVSIAVICHSWPVYVDFTKTVNV